MWTASHFGPFEGRNHRRMIARAFPAPRYAIDPALEALAREGRAREQKIDPQPQVATECAGPVAPPRIAALRLGEQAECILETEAEERVQCASLRLAVEDAVL